MIKSLFFLCIIKIMELLNGLLLGITLLSITLSLTLHNFIYKVTKTYTFVALFATFSFLYFVLVRWIPDIGKFFSSDINFLEQHDSYTYSIRWSKMLLLDMCPLVAFLLPLVCIFDRSKNIAKVIAPVAIFGGFITIAFTITTTNVTVPWYEFVFLGQDNNAIMFMMHFLTMMLGINIMLNSKKYTKWSFIGTLIFFALFLTYVLLCVNLLNIKNNATGLVSYDWIGIDGQYSLLYSMVPMPFPIIVIFWYSVWMITNFIVMLVKNKITKNKKNEKWFKNVTHIEKNMYKIDKYIDNKIFYFKKLFIK